MAMKCLILGSGLVPDIRIVPGGERSIKESCRKRKAKVIGYFLGKVTIKKGHEYSKKSRAEN